MGKDIYRLSDMKHVCRLGSDISIVYDYFGGFCLAAGLIDQRQLKFYPFTVLSLMHLTPVVALVPSDTLTTTSRVIGRPCSLLYK